MKEKALELLKEHASQVLFRASCISLNVPSSEHEFELARAIDRLYDAYAMLLECYKQENKK